ncbi:DUF2510 domain-containing protein [Lysinimonas soli]|uniref:DUF2510 domain-containing protein n=1 Tax=Lysinimonas soli TaxID=1074233 RepID=A0ABW0NQX0_9MICO
MSHPNEAPAAAWYPDPQSPGQVRWWDGTKWTEHVSAPARPVAAEPATLPIGRHAAGDHPVPRQAPSAPRFRPRIRLAEHAASPTATHAERAHERTVESLSYA